MTAPVHNAAAERRSTRCAGRECDRGEVSGGRVIPQYSRDRVIVFVVLVLVALAADLTSKEIVFERLGLYGQSEWLIDSWVRFELHTNLNRGALWGMGQGFAPLFAAISVGAFTGIVYWLFVRGAAASLWLTTAMALVCGGTLGNLYDRLGLHGIPLPGEDQAALAVRDFLHFQFGSFDWAIFNIADVCLVIGAMMLLIQSFRTPPQVAAVERSGSDPAAAS